MTRCNPMRTTDLPSLALILAAGGRLRHAQGFRLKATCASAKDREPSSSGRPNLVPMTHLAGLLEHSAVTRSVKSP